MVISCFILSEEDILDPSVQNSDHSHIQPVPNQWGCFDPLIYHEAKCVNSAGFLTCI